MGGARSRASHSRYPISVTSIRFVQSPLWFVGLVILIALAGAACSTDSSAEVASLADDTPTSTDGSAPSEGPLLTFAACMRDNGLDDFEDPIVGSELKVEFPNKADFSTGG